MPRSERDPIDYAEPGADYERDARAAAGERAIAEHRSIAERLARARAVRELDAWRDRLHDALGYPIALGYDQPEPGAHLHPEPVAGCYRCDLSADEYTGPDADVPALIAGNHRGTGSDHHAISDAQHATRYLDDDERGRFYD